jgi:mannose-6-phosphate isomerase-like protein (cupin superfamily)
MAIVKRKISLNDVKPDEKLTADDGFVNCAPRWIVTEETGASYGVFGWVKYLAGATHELHRHPNADEVFFVLSGHGVARSGEETFEIGAGDTVFVPHGDAHYFNNIDEKEPLIAIFAYFGAPSLEKAGHELAKP